MASSSDILHDFILHRLWPLTPARARLLRVPHFSHLEWALEILALKLVPRNISEEQYSHTECDCDQNVRVALRHLI